MFYHPHNKKALHNYNYEVRLFIYVVSQATSHTKVEINGFRFIQADAYSTGSEEVKTSIGIFEINNNRNVTMVISNQKAKYLELEIQAYRRIGTNS